MYYDTIESGRRIKALRQKKDMSQQEVAEKMGIHVKTISKAERGINGLSVDNLVLMAELFQVSIDYIVLGNENESQNIFVGVPKEKQMQIEKIVKEILKL